MFRRLVVPLLLLSLVSFAPAQYSPGRQVAAIRHQLPEFRDISVWKGRAGLARFSPLGTFLAVSGKTADVAIYNTATGELVTKIDGKGFTAFSFSPDEKHVIAQNRADGSMTVHEVEAGTHVRDIRGLGKVSNMSKLLGGAGIINELNGIFPVTVLEMGNVPATRDWKHLLVNKNDREFEIVDFASGEHRYDIKHANFNSGWEAAKLTLALLGGVSGAGTAGYLMLGSISNPQFSANGRYLLIASGNKKPTLWNMEDGSMVSKFESDSRIFYSKFSPDETMVATSDFDGVTRIWKTENGELVTSIGSKKEEGVIAGWSTDSKRVFVNPTGKGDLAAYDALTGEKLYDFAGSASQGAIFSDDQSLVFTTPHKNKRVLFQVWETATGKLLATVPREKKQDAVITVKWNPNNKLIATADGFKKPVHVWNISGELIQVLEHSTPPMEFSQDGTLLATGGIVPGQKKADIGYLWEFYLDQPERLAKAFLQN